MSSSSPAPRRGARTSAVAIGGSAGSLDPLLGLLERLPRDFPLPVAVVIHVPRDTPSGLVRALSPRSALPVREPFDKEPMEGGTVYVAAPGYHLLVEPGPCFAFSLDAPERFARPSIDVLFESAADVFGAGLVGVVLSGANDDGAAGLASLCRAGGLALVQRPEESLSPEMPRAALRACSGAEALPVSDIADRLRAVHLNGNPA